MPIPIDNLGQRIDTARQSGYDDDEIYQKLSNVDPRFSKAKDAGYGLDDLVNHFDEPYAAQQHGELRAPDTMGDTLANTFKHPLQTAGKAFGAVTGHALDEPEVNPVTGGADPTLGQVVATPLRMMNKGSEDLGSGVASGTGKVLRNVPGGDYAGAAAGTAAELLSNPANYVPEGDAIKPFFAPSNIAGAAKTLAPVVSEGIPAAARGLRDVFRSPLGPEQSVEGAIDALPGRGAVAQDIKAGVLGQIPANAGVQTQLSEGALSPEMNKFAQQQAQLAKMAEPVQDAEQSLQTAVPEAPEPLPTGPASKAQAPFYGQEGSTKGVGVAEGAKPEQAAAGEELAPLKEYSRAVTSEAERPAAIVEGTGATGEEISNTAQEIALYRQLRGLPLMGSDLRGLSYFDNLGPASHVIPSAVDDASRAYDASKAAESAYGDVLNRILKPLNPQEGRLVAAALDGQVPVDVLSGKLAAAYGQSKKLMDKLADLQGLDPNLRMSQYFPHVFTDPEAAARFARTGEIALDDQGILVKPTADPFLKKRFGVQGYTYNLGDALSTRISMAIRKEYLNPVVDHYMGLLDKMPDGPRAYMEGYLSRLQGRPTSLEMTIDRAVSALSMDRLGNGAARAASNFITKAYYRSLVGGAIDTAFKHVFQSANAAAETGFTNYAKGLAAFLTPRGQQAFKAAGVMREYSNIMEGMSDLTSSGKIMRAWDKIIFKPMELMQYLNRGVAYHAGLAQAAEEGLRGAGAIQWAKKVVDKTMFRYGVTNISPYVNNPIGKLFYQFSTYPANQIQFMRAMATSGPMARVMGVNLPVKLMRLFAVQGAFLGGAASLGADISSILGWQKSGKASFGGAIKGAVGGGIIGGLPGAVIGGAAGGAGLLTPGVGMPQEIIQHYTDTPSAPIQLAHYIFGKAAGGQSSKEAERQGQAALKYGAAGVVADPLRAIEKTRALADELNTGHAVTQKKISIDAKGIHETGGNYAYPISTKGALLKYLGWHPEEQEKYQERFQH